MTKRELVEQRIELKPFMACINEYRISRRLYQAGIFGSTCVLTSILYGVDPSVWWRPYLLGMISSRVVLEWIAYKRAPRGLYVSGGEPD